METIEQNKKIILEAWKKATDYNEKNINKLKSKYKVEMVESDEDIQTWKFTSNNVQFTFGWSSDFDDYELTGDALEFAEKHYEICDKTFCIVQEELKKNGFYEVDSDVWYYAYEKDDKNYTVPHFATEDTEIDVEDA